MYEDSYDGDGGGGGGQTTPIFRDDPQSGRLETLFERGMLNGDFTDAELFPDGTWHLIQSTFPTPDQLEWSHNSTAVNSSLWWLSSDLRDSISSHLTDWGVDAHDDSLNLVQLFSTYESFAVGSQRTADGFSSWVFTQETGVVLEDIQFDTHNHNGVIVDDTGLW